MAWCWVKTQGQLYETWSIPFIKTRRFITVFIRSRHWTISSARCIQSTPHPIFLRYVLILSFHPRLFLPSGLFRSDLQIKILNGFLIAICATCPAHYIFLDLITGMIFGWDHKLKIPIWRHWNIDRSVIIINKEIMSNLHITWSLV